jgi:hypothetical protein
MSELFRQVCRLAQNGSPAQQKLLMLAAVTAHNGRPMVPASDPVTIKLYAQRRFFQPRSGRYVSLDDLIARARSGEHIVIEDAHTGVDVTALALLPLRTEH